MQIVGRRRQLVGSRNCGTGLASLVTKGLGSRPRSIKESFTVFAFFRIFDPHTRGETFDPYTSLGACFLQKGGESAAMNRQFPTNIAGAVVCVGLGLGMGVLVSREFDRRQRRKEEEEATAAAEELFPATLYHIPRTCSSPVVQLLLELEIPPDMVRVKELTFDDLKTNSHPNQIMRTVPALQLASGALILESGAIITFLLGCIGPILARVKERESSGERGCVRDIPRESEATSWSLERRARLVSLLHFSTTVYTVASSTFLLTLSPTKDRTSSVKAAIETNTARFRQKIGPYLEDYLSDRSYFLDQDASDKSGISAADLILAKPLGNADAMGWLEPFPQLQGWLGRIKAQPSYSKAYTAEALPVYV